MVFGDFLLQLPGLSRKLAQLNEPFLAMRGGVTHPEGRTTHEDQDNASALPSARVRFYGLLTRVSHTERREASPPATAQPAACVRCWRRGRPSAGLTRGSLELAAMARAWNVRAAPSWSSVGGGPTSWPSTSCRNGTAFCSAPTSCPAATPPGSSRSRRRRG